MTVNNRIDLLFGSQGQKAAAQSAKAGAQRPAGMDTSQSLANRHAPPADFRKRDLLYHSIRQKLSDEFPLATFSQQAEIDGLAQDYLVAADYRQMWEEAARPPLALTADQERDRQRWQFAERVWPVVRRLLLQKELPSQPMCTPEEAKGVALEMNRGIQLLCWRLGIDSQTGGELEDVEVREMSRESAVEPCPAPSSNPITERAICESDAEDQAVLSNLGNLVTVLQDQDYVVGLLSGATSPTAPEWDAIQQVLEHERDMILARTEPDEPLKYALKRVKDAAAANLVANADKLIVLEHRLRKTEEVIAQKLRLLRKS